MENLNAYNDFRIEHLSFEEMEDVNGGSFFKDLAYVIAYTGRKVYEAYKASDTSGFMASPVGAGSKGAAGK
ncbi:MAG: hypothetical protein IPO07_23020 [Haliscomenobacter sp.]|nr:hypothetical protein [Haliscomenobacter sp.]MBK9491340.1 hypothetical protein [Haliscomenobacter sp.]